MVFFGRKRQRVPHATETAPEKRQRSDGVKEIPNVVYPTQKTEGHCAPVTTEPPSNEPSSPTRHNEKTVQPNTQVTPYSNNVNKSHAGSSMKQKTVSGSETNNKLAMVHDKKWDRPRDNKLAVVDDKKLDMVNKEDSPKPRKHKSYFCLVFLLLVWVASSAVLGGLWAFERIEHQLDVWRLNQQVLDAQPTPSLQELERQIEQLEHRALAAEKSARGYRSEFKQLLAKMEAHR